MTTSPCGAHIVVPVSRARRDHEPIDGPSSQHGQREWMHVTLAAAAARERRARADRGASRRGAAAARACRARGELIVHTQTHRWREHNSTMARGASSPGSCATRCARARRACRARAGAGARVRGARGQAPARRAEGARAAARAARRRRMTLELFPDRRMHRDRPERAGPAARARRGGAQQRWACTATREHRPRRACAQHAMRWLERARRPGAARAAARAAAFRRASSDGSRTGAVSARPRSRAAHHSAGHRLDAERDEALSGRTPPRGSAARRARCAARAGDAARGAGPRSCSSAKDTSPRRLPQTG